MSATCVNCGESMDRVFTTDDDVDLCAACYRAVPSEAGPPTLAIVHGHDHGQGTCEVLTGPVALTVCGQVATFRYPAMGGGYMYLCDGHGIKHAQHSEVWGGDRWIGAAPK